MPAADTKTKETRKRGTHSKFIHLLYRSNTQMRKRYSQRETDIRKTKPTWRNKLYTQENEKDLKTDMYSPTLTDTHARAGISHSGMAATTLFGAPVQQVHAKMLL